MSTLQYDIVRLRENAPRTARARPRGHPRRAPGCYPGRKPPRHAAARPAYARARPARRIRTPRATATGTNTEPRPRHGHCACCGCRSCPEGSPGGHRIPEPPPQCLLITTTSTPAARASCPAHGHYGTAPGAAASEQGWLRAMWGTQEIPEGPLQASETHPSTPQSHEPANQGEFQITAPLAT